MFSYNKPFGELHGLVLEIITTISLTGTALTGTLTCLTPVAADLTGSLTSIARTLAVADCTAFPLLLATIGIVIRSISADGS